MIKALKRNPSLFSFIAFCFNHSPFPYGKLTLQQETKVIDHLYEKQIFHFDQLLRFVYFLAADISTDNNKAPYYFIYVI